MSGLSKTRILVVDDNLELLDTYKQLLKTLGFFVECASNGKIAWDVLQSESFDVVFSDIKMPVMDGVELLKKIRARDKISPCVLMTSGFTDYPADILFQLGANGFLAKPMGATVIRDAISRASLRIEDLWKSPAKLIATETISKRYNSFDDLIASGEMRLGHGGFYLKQSNPSAAIHSVVNFSLTFENHGPFESIEGTGLVQWAHMVDSPDRQKGIGVEIKHLADGCRDTLCAWIRSQQFETFIPIQ